MFCDYFNITVLDTECCYLDDDDDDGDGDGDGDGDDDGDGDGDGDDDADDVVAHHVYTDSGNVNRYL